MLRVHIDLPIPEEKIACFYGELQETITNWAKESDDVTYLSMEGFFKPSKPFMSVCFDIIAYAGKNIINYRRYAQVWDERGNLIPRKNYLKAVDKKKRFPPFFSADGFYLSLGEERAIFNRFDFERANGMRRSQLPSLIEDIGASET